MRIEDIKEILGEEFDIRVNPEYPWLLEFGLRLSAVCQVHTGLANPDTLIHERDRVLIEFKRKLTELLRKYLGEVTPR